MHAGSFRSQTAAVEVPAPWLQLTEAQVTYYGGFHGYQYSGPIFPECSHIVSFIPNMFQMILITVILAHIYIYFLTYITGSPSKCVGVCVCVCVCVSVFVSPYGRNQIFAVRGRLFNCFWQACGADTFSGSQLENGRLPAQERMPTTLVDKMFILLLSCCCCCWHVVGLCMLMLLFRPTRKAVHTRPLNVGVSFIFSVKNRSEIPKKTVACMCCSMERARISLCSHAGRLLPLRGFSVCFASFN